MLGDAIANPDEIAEALEGSFWEGWLGASSTMSAAQAAKQARTHSRLSAKAWRRRMSDEQTALLSSVGRRENPR